MAHNFLAGSRRPPLAPQSTVGVSQCGSFGTAKLWLGREFIPSFKVSLRQISTASLAEETQEASLPVDRMGTSLTSRPNADAKLRPQVYPGSANKGDGYRVSKPEKHDIPGALGQAYTKASGGQSPASGLATGARNNVSASGTGQGTRFQESVSEETEVGGANRGDGIRQKEGVKESEGNGVIASSKGKLPTTGKSRGGTVEEANGQNLDNGRGLEGKMSTADGVADSTETGGSAATHAEEPRAANGPHLDKRRDSEKKMSRAGGASASAETGGSAATHTKEASRQRLTRLPEKKGKRSGVIKKPTPVPSSTAEAASDKGQSAGQAEAESAVQRPAGAKKSIRRPVKQQQPQVSPEAKALIGQQGSSEPLPPVTPPETPGVTVQVPCTNSVTDGSSSPKPRATGKQPETSKQPRPEKEKFTRNCEPFATNRGLPPYKIAQHSPRSPVPATDERKLALPQASCTEEKVVVDFVPRPDETILVVDSEEAAEKVVRCLMTQHRDKVHACDTEVANIDVKKESPVGKGTMTCFSIYCGPGVDFGGGHGRIWVDVLGERQKLLKFFRTYFEDPGIQMVWHNYSFDRHIFENHGIRPQGFHADTMHLARLWNSSRKGKDGGYSLEALTKDRNAMSGRQVMGVKDVWDNEEIPLQKKSMKELFGVAGLRKDGKQSKIRVVPPVDQIQVDPQLRDRWIEYSVHDAVSTWVLWSSMRRKLTDPTEYSWHSLEGGGSGTLYDFYQRFWKPFGEVLVDMEREGMDVDRGHLAAMERQARQQQAEAQLSFRKWATKHCPDAEYMNVGSDLQIRQLLFGGYKNQKKLDLEPLPMERAFQVPNIEGFVEEGRKLPKKTRAIRLRKVGGEISVEVTTASGWPAVNGKVLKALAGKIAYEYDIIKEDSDSEDSISEADSDVEDELEPPGHTILSGDEVAGSDLLGQAPAELSASGLSPSSDAEVASPHSATSADTSLKAPDGVLLMGGPTSRDAAALPAVSGESVEDSCQGSDEQGGALSCSGDRGGLANGGAEGEEGTSGREPDGDTLAGKGPSRRDGTGAGEPGAGLAGGGESNGGGVGGWGEHATSEVQPEDLSMYGKAYEAFGGGERGKEACRAFAALCELASINTLLSNFILPLQGRDIVGQEGRVHCSLNINTETGRLSARKPSLQNQPAVEKDRYKIRQAFRAAEGNCLIVADYGQLELRLLAHLADCTSMLDAFKAGGDFHSRTALNMYSHVREAIDQGEVLLEWDPKPDQPKPPVPLLKDKFRAERQKAKMLNFSIAYGKTAMGLAKDWKVTREEAQKTVELWYSDRPEVQRWQEERREEARHTLKVHTLLGRPRHLPGIRAAERHVVSHFERAAINTPVQGSAADVAMLAMLRITHHEELRNLGFKLLLQVHDEVILEGPLANVERAQAIVVECMEHPFPVNGGFFPGHNPLRVDLVVDANSAPDWYSAK